MIREKIRVLIVGGTLETSLHPVPPVADGAPEWNVFRLAEAAARNPECTLDIHVISPCEDGQMPALQEYPVQAQGKYHHIVFKTFQLSIYRKFLHYLLPLRLVVRRLAKLSDLFSWWYLRKVKSVLRELSPDVVFINARPQYVRYLRPVVPSGRLWLFMRGEMGESRKYLNLLDGIIVNSDGMAGYVREFILPEHPSVYKIPNTLGTEFIVPIDSSDRFSVKKIIFAGRLIPDKGVMELLNAFELVLRELPFTQLVICGASINFQSGDFRTEYEQDIRDRIASMPSGSVHLAGYIPNIELGSYYTDSSLAVFPSLCKESFGMVALEAMRCSTPVIASRQPGFEELITPGENGFLVDDPRNAQSLADAILKILLDDQLACKMGVAGYERSLQYLPETALHELEGIVMQSLGKSL